MHVLHYGEINARVPLIYFLAEWYPDGIEQPWNYISVSYVETWFCSLRIQHAACNRSTSFRHWLGFSGRPPTSMPWINFYDVQLLGAQWLSFMSSSWHWAAANADKCNGNFMNKKNNSLFTLEKAIVYTFQSSAYWRGISNLSYIL